MAFVEDLKLQNYSSVDYFLSQPHNRHHREVGKEAIAATLQKFDHWRNLQPPHIRAANHWYRTLFEKLELAADRVPKNPVHIITLNYDLSLERYLWITLRRRRADLSPTTVRRRINRLNILHLHGKVGGNPFQEYDSIGSPRWPPLKESARTIEIIDEQDTAHPKFAQASEWIRDSRILVFLGFGFHKDVLSRFDAFPIPGDTSQVYATSLGLPQGSRWRATRMVTRNIEFSATGCQQALTEKWRIGF